MLLRLVGTAERSVLAVRHGWRSMRRWQRRRPFWAGCLLVFASAAVIAAPYATLRLGDAVVAVQTLGGASALVIGVLLTACAIRLWVRPHTARSTGIVAMLLALVALVTTNLGGLLLGTLLGIVGGALSVAWTDRPRSGDDT